jgi:hypothetical protein
VFKYIVARPIIETDEIERLHSREPPINFCLADNDSQQIRLEPFSDHRGRLQQCAVVCGKAINAGV